MTAIAEPKHERLAQALFLGKSVALASRLAGYSNPMYDLCKEKHITERVIELLEAAANDAVMTAREWEERETRRARVDPRAFFDLRTGLMLPMQEWPDDAAEAIESFEMDPKGGFKIKFAKTQAMNNMGKRHKLLTDKVELSGKVESSVTAITGTMTPQEAAEAYAAMLSPGT